MAVILKPSTLLYFHRALVKRKYRLLYSPRQRRRPGPKGPSRELIDTVVEMKPRNPRFGCRKIAEQISSTFGIEINKDIVRRILIQHYRPLHRALHFGVRRHADGVLNIHAVKRTGF